MIEDRIYEFSDSIGDTYLFNSDLLQYPYRPSWRMKFPHDDFTPASLREFANELEDYQRKFKTYNDTLAKNRDNNKKIVDRFVNDVLSFLNLSDHPKKDSIIKYCKDRVKSSEFTVDYLRDLFWELVNVREIV